MYTQFEYFFSCCGHFLTKYPHQEWRGNCPSPKIGPRGASPLASSLPFSSCAPVTLSVTRARERDWLASLQSTFRLASQSRLRALVTERVTGAHDEKGSELASGLVPLG